MSIKIGSNLASLNAQRRLGDATNTLSSVYEKLSSGQRINRASDDAAGLAIADDLNAKGRVYTQAIRNGNDALSLLQIADGAYDQISGILIRISELAEQSANGIFGSLQRQALDAEAQALRNEINRISASTEFNGIKLLDGSAASLAIQIGDTSEDSSRLNLTLERAVETSAANGTFEAEQKFVQVSTAIGIQTADLNGDGNLDILIGADRNIDSLVVLLGTGAGAFAPLVNYDAGRQVRSFALADFNNDGNLDVVTNGNNDSGLISVLLGDGSGSFGANTKYTTGQTEDGGIAVGDLNADGYVDILAGSSGESTYAVLLGNGTGTFLSSTTYSGTGNIGSLADFNGDGILDLSSQSGFNTVIQLGMGDGTFGAGINYASSVYNSSFGDLDNDGDLDIVNSTNGNTISVLLNAGNGTFDPSVSYAASAQTKGINLVDINGDGNLDAVSYNSSGGSAVDLFIGDGEGSFLPSTGLSGTAFSSRSALALADVDADGAIDIITASSLDNYVNFFLGETVETASMEPVSLLTAQDSLATLTKVKNILTRLSSIRSRLGADESRVSTAISNLQTAKENFAAAESRIRDADIASETANLVRTQILQQAATSVLSQANQQPNLVLQLLR